MDELFTRIVIGVLCFPYDWWREHQNSSQADGGYFWLKFAVVNAIFFGSIFGVGFLLWRLRPLSLT